jgi:hypothetical protein
MQLYLKLCEREKNTTGMSGEQAYQIFTAIQPGKVLITYATALQQCIRSDRLWSITRHTLPPANINEQFISDTLVVTNILMLLCNYISNYVKEKKTQRGCPVNRSMKH